MECWECYAHTFGGVVRKLSKDEALGYEIITKLTQSVATHFRDSTPADIKGTPILEIADEVIPTAQAVGLDLLQASDSFKDAFENADLVVFKGMGYFENSYEYDKNSFFILKAKCEPVARYLGVNKGDNIVLGKKYSN